MDYFTEIETHFALRRGTPFVVSAKDWLLMKGWSEAGIPLPVVIEAIDSVFEKNETSGRKKTISSLSYCRHAVKELWQERRELAVGEGEMPEGNPAARLASLAGELEASDVEAVRFFAPRLRELERERSVPRIEERLLEIESEMVEAILGGMSAAEGSAIRGEISAVIGDVAKLDEKTLRRTEEANLRRLIRERFDLPRLTLFH